MAKPPCPAPHDPSSAEISRSNRVGPATICRRSNSFQYFDHTGYDRIADALANLGHEIADQTVGNILKSHGIEPAPDRKWHPNWSTFLKAHWNQLAAVDFTTIEVWTTGGLTTFYLLFAMRLATRRVYLAGCTIKPTGPWMAQVGRNLTDAVDGPFRELVQYVLMDRDSKFTAEFRAVLKSSGVASVLLPPKSPNCNAHLERFFRSLQEEALERMIFFSERSLRSAINEILAHFHTERNHQSLNHEIIEPGAEVGQWTGG